MALGADGAGIVRLILREAFLLLGIGLVVGVGLAHAAARTASSMLFGLKPYDPATLAFAIVTLAMVAVAASYIPARRAAGVDPMVALREE
jgi:ABC-type antimicrobial peptide transport system permease subunit